LTHSIEAIFLGYCKQSKAYCLLNNHNKNIIISRDIIFNENFHNYQIIVENEEEKLIDSHLFTTPLIMSTNKQPNINTNFSFQRVSLKLVITNQEEHHLPTQQLEMNSSNIRN